MLGVKAHESRHAAAARFEQRARVRFRVRRSFYEQEAPHQSFAGAQPCQNEFMGLCGQSVFRRQRFGRAKQVEEDADKITGSLPKSDGCDEVHGASSYGACARVGLGETLFSHLTSELATQSPISAAKKKRRSPGASPPMLVIVVQLGAAQSRELGAVEVIGGVTSILHGIFNLRRQIGICRDLA